MNPIGLRRFLVVVMSLVFVSGGRAEEESGKAELTLELAFPAGAEISPEAVFWGRLWEYDPLLADAAAKMVDSVEMPFAKFGKGEGGVVTVSAKLASALQAGRKYYVTVFVYPDAKKDEGARRFFLDGFNKVFEDGKGQVLKGELKATG